VTTLPDSSQQPTAVQAGQPTHEARRRAAEIAAAVDAVYEKPTSFRDDSPVPAIGTAPPVPQPGRPPMSQRAVDLNTTILSSSILTAVLGGAVSAVLWASGEANPTVIKWICACAVAAPVAIATAFLAAKSLAKSAKEVVQAAPPEIHQHYSGHVHQDNRQNHLHTQSNGLIATTRNELPPAR
jgi:hypothetical protein